MIAGLTVLVVEPDARARAALVAALRKLGLHAFGAFAPIDALALLDGIDAEVVTVRAGDPDVAVRVLASRTLVVELEPRADVERSVERVRSALGQPPSEHPAN